MTNKTRHKHTGGVVTANPSNIGLSTRTDRTSSIGGGKSNVKRGGKVKHTGLRAYSPKAEAKYIGIRGGASRSFYLNEILDQQLFMHLQKEYGNQAELDAILKLTGHLGALRLSFKFMSTKEDMMRYYAMAEKARYDRKFPLTKAEAVARFATGKDSPPRPVSRVRPGEFRAKPTTPYRARPGSSKGKVKTIVRGGRKTLIEFEKFIKTLFSMQPDQRKGYSPTVKRTISKIIED